MRLDKFISNIWYASRKEISQNIKNMNILINSVKVNKKDFEVNFWDKINIWDLEIIHKEFIYIILNKPIWYVSSRVSEWWHKSYLELIKDCPYYNLVNIVWRLDFDTSWLVFLTNNWELTHKLINPKKDVFKKYYVKSQKEITDNDIEKLKNWVLIDDFITKPSIVEKINSNEIYLSISEWKFHQIKKMLESINNKVIELKRISIWNINLWDLEIWKYRYLTDEEIKNIL